MSPVNARVFEQQKTVEAWDRDYYDPIAERYYDLAVEDMRKLLGAKAFDNVLDAGCGPGVHSIRMARTTACQMTAVDISETMLDQARQRAVAAGVSKNITFQREDLTGLSFPDGAFRYVFSWGVIIHIRDAEKALDELARVTAPGGSLALYVTNNAALDQRIEKTVRALLGKKADRENLPLGTLTSYAMNGEQLWVWQFNIDELLRQMEMRGLTLVHRLPGEFSEFQRRISGLPRKVLLHINNAYYRMGMPASLAITNLLVFRKKG